MPRYTPQVRTTRDTTGWPATSSAKISRPTERTQYEKSALRTRTTLRSVEATQDRPTLPRRSPSRASACHSRSRTCRKPHGAAWSYRISDREPGSVPSARDANGASRLAHLDFFFTGSMTTLEKPADITGETCSRYTSNSYPTLLGANREKISGLARPVNDRANERHIHTADARQSNRPADGQCLASLHASHFGFRAEQTFRPCQISMCPKFVHCF